jgi:hypothetical protein
MEAEEVEEGIIIWTGDFWRGSGILQRGELSFGVGLDQYRHRVAGGFGHGGQDIHMISWS